MFSLANLPFGLIVKLNVAPYLAKLLPSRAILEVF